MSGSQHNSPSLSPQPTNVLGSPTPGFQVICTKREHNAVSSNFRDFPGPHPASAVPVPFHPVKQHSSSPHHTLLVFESPPPPIRFAIAHTTTRPLYGPSTARALTRAWAALAHLRAPGSSSGGGGLGRGHWNAGDTTAHVISIISRNRCQAHPSPISPIMPASAPLVGLAKSMHIGKSCR